MFAKTRDFFSTYGVFVCVKRGTEKRANKKRTLSLCLQGHSLNNSTRWGGLRDLLPHLEIEYKTAKSRGTKIELFSCAEISTGLPKGGQCRRAMQGADGEGASPRSSPTAL